MIDEAGRGGGEAECGGGAGDARGVQAPRDAPRCVVFIVREEAAGGDVVGEAGGFEGPGAPICSLVGRGAGRCNDPWQ